MTFPFPAGLKPRNCFYELREFSASGGASITGDEFRTFIPTGKWWIKYNFQIRTRAQALAFRTLVTRLRAGENVVAKVFDKWQAADAPALGFEAGLAANAAARATTLQLETVGLFLEPGTAFSLGNHMHRLVEVTRIPSVVHVTPDSEVIADATRYPDNPPAYPDLWTAKILPPTREAVTAGTPVDFRDLRCLCRIETLTDGDLDLDLYRFADPTLTLVEAL